MKKNEMKSAQSINPFGPVVSNPGTQRNQSKSVI